MAKKAKKITRTKKVVSKKAASPVGFLFRRYDNNVAFTLVVSCAAYAIFMLVNTILQQTSLSIMQQEQQIASMKPIEMGQVAGVSDSQE